MTDRFHYHVCANSGTPYVLDTQTFQKYYENEPGDLLELTETMNRALFELTEQIAELRSENDRYYLKIDELEDEVAHFRHAMAVNS